MAHSRSHPGYRGVQPSRAPVRPRAARYPSLDVLPLEAHVQLLLDEGERGCWQLVGGAGAGKSMALAHLAAVFAGRAELVLLDEPYPSDGLQHYYADSLAIFTSSRAAAHATALALAPWGQDDWIEYLLNRHRDQCASVMNRLTADDKATSLRGVPELWRPVLDEMALDAAVPTAWAGLGRALDRMLADPQQRRRVAIHSLKLLCPEVGLAGHMRPRPASDLGAMRFVRHREAAMLLVAAYVFDELIAGRGEAELSEWWVRDLVGAVATAVEGSSDAQERLIDVLHSNRDKAHPMAASVLVTAGTGWRPAGAATTNLKKAYLSHARWAGAHLHGVNLSDADLSHADLRDARMAGANLIEAKLRHAHLRGATLLGVKADMADFTGANLIGVRAMSMELEEAILRNVNAERAVFKGAQLPLADLSSARFVEADFSDCSMLRTTVRDADFSGVKFAGAALDHIALHTATLTGASFAHAALFDCDLECVALPHADFTSANLTHSLFTGSIMPHACFRGARLCHTGLADVEWEYADLRDADFTHATFHMGSSRSGMVGSIIPSEGSRTGFYTDDFHEQDFKSPEEIRKANLRGADLRGARVNDADFYLVDLRGAHYTPKQAEHFRRCGAILHARR